MSYADTNCACGGRKLTDSLLCAKCEASFATTDDLATYRDERASVVLRRTAAIRLLALARRRRQPYLPVSGVTREATP